LCFVCLVSLWLTTAAQTIWPKKPYTQWTLDEVTRILSNSQWTRIEARSSPTAYRSDSPDRPPGIEFMVAIRLYSALPVRQAIVRRMQLTIPHDKLSPAQRTSFDAEVDGLLKCPHCEGFYIITLASSSTDRLNLITRGSNVTFDVVALLKQMAEEDVLRHTFLLNDRGERRNATNVVFTPRNEVVMLFPRFDERGNRLIAPTDKKFYVDFDEYLTKKVEGTLTRFTFEVKDLVHDGEVMF